jgi:hypothetical protein
MHESGTTYGIEDEDSKININLVSRTVLTTLPGVDREIADCIIDWRDKDDKTRPRGAEEDYYESNALPYSCSNRPFECLEEVLMVKGMDLEILNTLEPFITVYGDSAINVFTAHTEVLKALGLNEELITKIVDYRSNESSIEELLADGSPTVDKFILLLNKQENLTHKEQVLLRSYFSMSKLKFSSEIFRIRSEGVTPVIDYSGKASDATTTVIEAVYKREPGMDGDSGQSSFLYWREI